MIIYNLLATAMLVVSLVIGALIAAGLHRMNSYDSPVFLVTTGFFMIVLDFWYRTTRGEGSFFHPRRGGQFFFIPVWVIGAGLAVFNFFLMFVNEIGVSARQSNPNAKTSISQKSSNPAAFAYTPERAYRSLNLGMISGVGSNRIATINGQPFAEGESHMLSIASTKRVVQCTEIRTQSVVLTLSGESQPLELKIGEPLQLNRR
jgi:hypothetical protein